MKFLISKKVPKEEQLQKLSKRFLFNQNQLGFVSVIKEENTVIKRKGDLTTFIDGYIRNFNFNISDVDSQIENALEIISYQWPVSESISGSFGCTLIDENNREIILCNDSIGVYPVYYCIKEDDFFISNSLIWLGCISGTGIDEVGLFQRAYCPEFSNIGSRTILKDTKRLLPGEWIKLNEKGEIEQRKFDNELYQNISESITPDFYWKQFKKELAYCVGKEESVHIALSGGMDSRLLISGLPQAKNFYCHTYGKSDYYETKIARRIANLHNAQFQNYSHPELYIPNRKIFEKYTLNTEAVYINHWLEVLEEQELDGREMILLGDMTESLQGRNLPVNKNWENFKRYYIENGKYELKENTPENFSKWKADIRVYYTALISQKHIDRLKLSLSGEQLKEGINEDLEYLFSRVEAHNLPFMELVQELFSWFTHSRIPMGKQILILDSAFNSYCVPMSIQVLRLTSNLHPNLRVNGRFIKSIFNSIKDLNPAGKVPTSQIPFVSFNTSDIIKLPIWYLRSGIDDFLIKRLMKTGNPDKRYRALKSFNWAEIYQHQDMEKNLRSVFESNNLGDYAESVINGALARRDLKQWPLSNVNIVNAAALNTEIGFIRELKGEETKV